MIVLKATQEDYDKLEGWSNNRNGLNELRFAPDANGNWVVGMGVLENPEYEEIWPELNALERIEFFPIIETENFD